MLYIIHEDRGQIFGGIDGGPYFSEETFVTVGE